MENEKEEPILPEPEKESMPAKKPEDALEPHREAWDRVNENFRKNPDWEVPY